MKQYLSIIVRYFCFSLFFVLPWWWLWERNGELGTISDSLCLTARQESTQNLDLCLFVGWSICEFYEREHKSVRWDASYCMVAL